MTKTCCTLESCIHDALETYFMHLEDQTPTSLYEMVVKRVELPMLELVLKKVNGNQSVAAEYLGINRNTLRKKMKDHQLL